MPRRLLSAAAACTLLLGLAACGEGGDGPVTTPPPSIDVGGSSDGGGDGGASDAGGEEESPSAAPDVPAPDPADYAGMDENTPEGAEQAFKYYIAMVYWAHETGDSEPLSSLYRDSCESCADLINDVAELRSGSGLWSGVEIDEVWSESQESGNFNTEVSYGFKLSPHVRPFDAGGDHESEDIEMTAVAGLDWSDGRWVVGGMQLAESEHG